jgi:tRNA pseudouridine32 synthase/23S rRNA pseudouridine746 synthase
VIAQQSDVSVLYADDALLVLNKPAGLLSVPGRGEDKQDCLSARVQRCYPNACVVHRLDMATSGLLVMARGIDAQRQLNQAFASRAVLKRYEAVVAGALTLPDALDASGWSLIDLPIYLDWPRRPLRTIDLQHGKPSLTRWRVLSVDEATQTTRLMLEPMTGRSHQLRVHLQAIGHPILGDTLYAPSPVQALAPRLLLHASCLELPHPVSGQPMRWDCPAPF